MPNWCNNVLELTHEDPVMITRASNAASRGELLNEFIPVPEDLRITAGRLADSKEQKDLEAQEEINLHKHGYRNWYDFCVNEWGTKWDIEAQEEINLHKHGYRNWYDFCVNEWGTKWDIDAEDQTIDRQGGTRLTLSFDSAWSPPTGAYAKLQDLGFAVKAYYYEPGMAFAGIYDENGDDCYNIEGSSESVRENIPEELDEMFAISESMAEYEDENQEIDLDDGLSAINEQEKHDE